MRRRVWLMVLLIALAVVPFATQPALASSTPSFTGNVRGMELCPQAWCGAAVFMGGFDGQLRDNTASGGWWVAIRHDALPDGAGSQAPITGGRWGFRIGSRFLYGIVDGGTLTDNGNNTYTVDATLRLTFGGTGTVEYVGTLDHNSFPPAINGTLTQ